MGVSLTGGAPILFMTNKLCAKCRETKSIDDFFRSKFHSKDGHDYYCKVCRKSLRKEWAHANKEEVRKYQRGCMKQLKDDVVNAYGAKCACCGETYRVFLALDHINGGGGKHRREHGGAQTHYRDARNRNFPPDYQLLCHNCNWAKHVLGQCPHQLEQTLNG